MEHIMLLNLVVGSFDSLQFIHNRIIRNGKMKTTIFRSVIVFAVVLWSGITAAGPIMHVHDSGGNLGTVDVATGNVNVIGTMGTVMTDIAFDPLGNLFGITFSGLYSINATTATSTFIGNHGISGGNALVFGTDGTLYGAGGWSTSLFTIDGSTGLSTNLGTTGFSSGGDLAFNNGDLFLASTTGQLVNIDLVDLSNTMAVGSFGVEGVFGLASSSTGDLFAVAGTNIYQADITTGAATNPPSFLGQGLGGAYGQSFFTEAGATIPEPSTILLLGAGLFCLIRKQKCII